MGLKDSQGQRTETAKDRANEVGDLDHDLLADLLYKYRLDQRDDYDALKRDILALVGGRRACLRENQRAMGACEHSAQEWELVCRECVQNDAYAEGRIDEAEAQSVEVAAMRRLVDAAVGWWEDHNREECHFCGVREDGAHDHGCPVGDYLALRMANPRSKP